MGTLGVAKTLPLPLLSYQTPNMQESFSEWLLQNFYLGPRIRLELGVPIPVGDYIDLKCLLHSFFLDYMFIWCGLGGTNGRFGRSQLHKALLSALLGATPAWTPLNLCQSLSFSKNFWPSFLNLANSHFSCKSQDKSGQTLPPSP